MLSHPFRFQVISPRLYRLWSGEFENNRVYRGNNMAVKSPSDEHNITVQFLIILTIYFSSEIWGKGQY